MGASKGHPNLGQHMKGRRVHTAHLGYDLYTCGTPSSQNVRCILRRHRMPPRIDTDIRDMLPDEFRWPTGNHEEAWLAIDALMLVDVPNLESLIRQYPDHHFGFEQYIEKGRRWRAAAHRQGVHDLPDVRATDGPLAPGGRPRRSITAPLFPGWVKYTEPLETIVLEDITLRMSIVYFTDDTPAMRIDAYANSLPVDKTTRLTRLHSDLTSPKYEIIEHFPGRYVALGLDPNMLKAILNVERLGMGRRSIYDHPDVLQARERARLQAEQGDEGRRTRSKRVIEESHALSSAVANPTHPDWTFGAHLFQPKGVSR